ncbi:hypothetical protein GCM10022234_00530 [Aeromicrobium panaciterrae]|uniref:hypothetical protein n=1 Tax=Aeromicrobium panaciterrae TaxID=363861 RepID=UPI0031DC44C1
MKKLIAVIALATSTLFVAAPAMATDTVPETTTSDTSAANGETAKHDKPKPVFEVYEVDACWQMATSDGVEGTYEWPQTRVYGEECGATPACGETVEFQHDTYWIRDKEDKQYLKHLKVLNSPADDAQLEPHDYYSTVVHGGECIQVAPPTITQPTCENPDYTVDWVSSGPHWTGEIIYPPNSSAPNVINVTANADDGYEIEGDSYWELVIVPLSDDDCDTSTPPTTPPSDTPSDAGAVLPDTGAPKNLVLGVIGALLTIAGAGILRAQRRHVA